jgi:hypothetical protein
MKWTQPLAVTLALVASAPAALAQEDKSNEMWASFYEKLTSVIKQGNKDPELVVSLCVPGTPLLPLKQSDPLDAGYVNELLSMAPKYNTVWTPSDRPIADIYKLILEKHQVVGVTPLTPAEQAELDKAVQETSGDKIEAYDAWKLRYEDAAMAVQEEKLQDFARKEGRGGTFNAKPSTMAAMTKAKSGWESRVPVRWEGKDEPGGNRLQVEKNMSTIREFEARDPTSWWADLQDKFRKGMFNDTYVIQTFPALDLWADDKGWVKFSFQASDKVDTSSLSERDIAAAVAVKTGKLDLAGKFGMSDKLAKTFGSDKSMKITMEMKRVYFRRPWMDAQVFYARTWRWAPGSGVKISDGQGNGVLPMISNSLIIVRNVVFTSKALENSSEIKEQSLSAELAVSYGPFTVNGSYSHHNKKTQMHAKMAKGSISIPDPQIVAYVSTVVPKCPNPK